MSNDPLLAVDNVQLDLEEGGRLLDGITFSVRRGEALGVVGESGSGKSLTALTVLGLVSGMRTKGAVRFCGTDLMRLSERAMRRLRGRKIAMVFQDPMTALFPVRTIGAQIVEQIRLHHRVSRRQAWVEAVHLLGRTGMPDPDRIARRYPHQLSGGLRQRAMIAMALSCNPDLLIADEPTTALDVTIQAQILVLLRTIRDQGAGLMLITHDLGVVAQLCTHVVVMYAGVVVERGPAHRVLEAPLHPYTQALRAAMLPLEGPRPERLPSLPGTLPSPSNRPEGCVFAPRCAFVQPACQERPRLRPVDPAWPYPEQGDAGRRPVVGQPGFGRFDPDGPNSDGHDPGRYVACVLYPERASSHPTAHAGRAVRADGVT